MHKPRTTPPTNAIGRIEKVVGEVTVMRNGVAVALHVGDAVYKSDVVQTGANSSCGIGFPDGTALNLVANTRMALNDYVYDPNGTSNDALFSLVQGGFAFVAGKVAHTGDMKITTPVATMGIRGTTGYALQQVATVNANLGNVTMSFAVVADPGTDRVGEYELIDQFGNVVARVGRAGEWTDVSWRGANSTPDISTHPMTAANFSIEQQLIPALVQILNSLGNLTPTPQSGPNNPGSSTPPNFLLLNLLQNPQQLANAHSAINGSNNNTNGQTTPVTFTFAAGPLGSSSIDIWTSSSGGTWENGSNWAEGAPSAQEAVEISQPVKVTIGASETIAGVALGSGTILNIGDGGSLTVSNEIANQGVLQINSSGADPTLAINGRVYLLNGGILTMVGPTAENLITGVDGTGAKLINVHNTIEGSGTIGQGDGTLTLFNGRAGKIEATPLLATDSGLLIIDTGNNINNFGLLSASGGGGLQIEDSITNLGRIRAHANSSVLTSGGVDNFNMIKAAGPNAQVIITDQSVSNESGAIIEAARGGLITLGAIAITNSGTIEAIGENSTVELKGTSVSGGMLATQDGGVIETLSQTNTFSNVTLAGGSLIETHGGSTLGLLATTTLAGTVTFKGSGTFTLDVRSEIVGQVGMSTELDNEGTISGAGKIGAGGRHFVLVNAQSGVIDASGGNPLILDTGSNTITNLGLLKATAGGELDVDSSVNNASGTISAQGAGSTVELLNITITGGTLTTDDPAAGMLGVIYVETPTTETNTTVFDGSGSQPVIVTGFVDVQGGATLELIGTINVGNAESGFDVAGFLTNPAQSPTSGTIFADSGATIDLVVTNLVGGDLKTAAATNTDAAGLIDVTGNAISAISDATVSNSGELRIEQGSQLDVSGTVLTGGVLSVAGILDSVGTSAIENANVHGGGDITVTRGQTLTFDKVTLDNVALSGGIDNAATLTIDDTVTLNGATISGGTIVDTGALSVSASSTIENTALNDGHVTVASGVTLTLENITGIGTVLIENGGQAIFQDAVSQNVTFNNNGPPKYGALVLDDPSQFTGVITGFTGTGGPRPSLSNSDEIDLVDINYNSGDFSHTYNSATGVLTVTDDDQFRVADLCWLHQKLPVCIGRQRRH